ncbi:Putative disease resistance protein [Arachis hypogaea]|nr:Putative disease resistance protein [Arachis hypogaea]
MSGAPHAALQCLSISGCHKLVPFAGEGLAAPNLTLLQVVWCSKLEALPRDMKSLLPTLQSLEIYGCQRGYYCDNIKSYPEVGSLPHLPSLTTLKICFFDNLETLEYNELLRLASLQQLQISCCQKLENMEGEKLPPSLLLLKIERCQVGSLPHLPSLTTLQIWCLKNLETFECNELLHLNSLKQLHIVFCEKLENMEGEKPPPSLLLLQIQDCDLMGEHCWRIWQEKSFLPFTYYFKFKTVFCSVNATRRIVAAKLSMKGPKEIHNCYSQGIAFFMDSTNKMCIRPLLSVFEVKRECNNVEDIILHLSSMF